eukprot:3573405-Rhodomonas_salina.2
MQSLRREIKSKQLYSWYKVYGKGTLPRLISQRTSELWHGSGTVITNPFAASAWYHSLLCKRRTLHRRRIALYGGITTRAGRLVPVRFHVRYIGQSYTECVWERPNPRQYHAQNPC